MSFTPKTIHEAPFSPEQVAALNRYQQNGIMHPYTCGNEKYHHPGDRRELIATTDGWICPDPNCGYTQKWARKSSLEDQASLQHWEL